MAENNAAYYDGAELLSQKDLDGLRPEIFMVTTNKTGGKTTFFSRLVVNGFKKRAEKFMLLYRFKYELDDCADKLFKCIKNLYFPNDTMTSKSMSDGIYHNLFLNDEHCGYAVAINSADQIKKMSHLFSDTACMFMDEFQSETGHYCADEIKKFRMVHAAIARGEGKFVRYVPVYMCANPITILNPYYTAMGISCRLNKYTHFLRGRGFVLEQGFVEKAAEAQKESGFNRAFGDDTYNAYQSSGSVYLNDSVAFIEKPNGNSYYIATIQYMGGSFALREYPALGIVYCDDKVDKSFPLKISVTTDDHDINYVMLKRNDGFLMRMRWYFEHACFRFKDLRCKEAIIKALSY